MIAHLFQKALERKKREEAVVERQPRRHFFINRTDGRHARSFESSGRNRAGGRIMHFKRLRRKRMNLGEEEREIWEKRGEKGGDSFHLVGYVFHWSVFRSRQEGFLLKGRRAWWSRKRKK